MCNLPLTVRDEAGYFVLLSFQRARKPLSEYCLLHSSTRYTVSQVEKKSFLKNVHPHWLLNHDLTQLTTRDCVNTLPLH